MASASALCSLCLGTAGVRHTGALLQSVTLFEPLAARHRVQERGCIIETDERHRNLVAGCRKQVRRGAHDRAPLADRDGRSFEIKGFVECDQLGLSLGFKTARLIQWCTNHSASRRNDDIPRGRAGGLLAWLGLIPPRITFQRRACKQACPQDDRHRGFPYHGFPSRIHPESGSCALHMWQGPPPSDSPHRPFFMAARRRHDPEPVLRLPLRTWLSAYAQQCFHVNATSLHPIVGKYHQTQRHAPTTARRLAPRAPPQ
jgi:hypothetical protein